jgi:hypothetical protein
MHWYALLGIGVRIGEGIVCLFPKRFARARQGDSYAPVELNKPIFPSLVTKLLF